MLVDISLCPSFSSTDKYNYNKNDIEELGMIALETINVYLKTSEISSNPLKIGHGLTQFYLVPLGTNLIYNTNKRNSIM